MSIRDELIAARDSIVHADFAQRTGSVVPNTSDVGYDQAVKLDATYLYSDMVNSSGLRAACPPTTVGKVLRLYLDLSVRITRSQQGHIRSFDGDRVMGIFIGADRADRAVKAALQILWACDELIQPEISGRYKSIQKSGWRLKPASGVASSSALLVRGGVRRSSSDLVSIGVAPNLAAKLSDIRSSPYQTRIGKGTYAMLSDSLKRGAKGNLDMWDGVYSLKMANQPFEYYRSSYRWRV